MKIVMRPFDLPEGVDLPTGRVPVTLDFDATRPVGMATLGRNEQGQVYVEAELTDDAVCADLTAGWRGSELLTVGCLTRAAEQKGNGDA